MKKIIFISSLLTISCLAIFSTLNTTNASASLPADGTAGAPMDNAGQTCGNGTTCHTGSVVTQTTGVISTNIPGSGFVGGVTYSVSVTMSGAAAYGFEMTAQTASSNVGLGNWIAGSGSSVSTKYIKQTTKKLGPTAAVWTFSWTAPTTATAVTFYGSFNYANNNSSSSGDLIKTSSVTFIENTTGLNELCEDVLLSVFPNPTIDVLHVTSGDVFKQGNIYTLDGKLAKIISDQELVSKTIQVSELNNGIYYIQIIAGNKILISKFIKNN